MADDTGTLGPLLGFFDRGYDPQKAYEGLLSEQPTKDAMLARALAGMAGAFGQGAMPSPYKGGTPFLATLGQAAQAAYGAQDELMKARNLAAEQQLHYAQAGLASSQVGINKLLGPAYQEYLKKYGVGGGTDTAGADKAGPAKILSEAKGTVFDTGDPFLNLTAYHESGYRPNIGTGENDLSGHALDANGFPIWKGIDTPKGNSSAAGLFQITRTNWNTFAPPLIQAGVMKPDFSVESQIAVAKAMRAANGTADWLPYNKPLAEAHARGDVVKVPGSPASTEAAPAAAGAAAGGLLNPPSPGAGLPGVDTPYAAAGAALPAPGPVGAPPTPRPAQPPGVSLNSQGQPISQDLSRNLPGQRIGAAAVAPNPNFGAVSPAIEAARAATAAEFGPGQRGLLGPQPAAAPPPPATPISTGAEPAAGGGLLAPDVPRPAGRLGGIAQALAQGAMPPSLIADAGSAGAIPGVDTPYATTAPPPPAPAVPSLLTPPLPGAPAAAGPPAAGGMPPLPRAPAMPPIPTAMPPVAAPPLPTPTPQQGMAMGIAGLSALTGHPAPPFIQEMAKMPAQMALEQYKAWVGAVANMQGEAYKKQVEAAYAQTISAGQAAGKYPYDLAMMNATQAAELQKELALKGLYRDPITGQTIGLPGFNEAMAAQEGAKASAVAEAQQKTKLEQIEREQRERGQQARLTARDEVINKPVLIPGVGLVVPGQLPGFNYQSVDSAVPNVAGPGAAAPPPGTQTSSGVLFHTQSEPQKAFLAANIAATEKRLAEYHTEQAAAPEQIGTADMIEKLIPATQFGWGEDTKVQGAMILKRLGVNDKDLKEYLGVNTAAAGDLSKLFLRFSTAAVRQMGAREPGSVIGLFVRNFPSLESDPDTARTMTNVLRMQAQYQQDRGAAAMRYANEQQRNAGIHGENYTGMNNFLESFDKTNPMRDYTRAAAAMSGYREMGQETHGVLKGLAWNGINQNEDDMKRVVRLIPQGHQYLGPDGNIWNR